MPMITIDGKEYNSESFSEEALAQLRSLQFVDRKLEELKNEQVIYLTARNSYAKALLELLPSEAARPN